MTVTVMMTITMMITLKNNDTASQKVYYAESVSSWGHLLLSFTNIKSELGAL